MHTSECLPVRGDTLTVGNPQCARFVRRPDGGFGVLPLPYGVPPPKTLAVHFLSPQLRRKTLIERRLVQERAGRLFSARGTGRPDRRRDPVAARPAPGVRSER